jgi:hypothetical protein
VLHVLELCAISVVGVFIGSIVESWTYIPVIADGRGLIEDLLAVKPEPEIATPRFRETDPYDNGVPVSW